MKHSTKMIAGNWKMNGLLGDSITSAASFRRQLMRKSQLFSEYIIFPPAHLLIPLTQIFTGTSVRVGAQDCHPAASGRYTGDISATMLRDIGCSYVIVGHSERRIGHGESDALVRSKAAAVLENGMTPVICVGEQSDVGSENAAATVVEQLRASCPDIRAGRSITVAYEPIWAIGTEKTASPDHIVALHTALRRELVDLYGPARAAAMPILYGGSVNVVNGPDILRLDHVDGVLVGQPSLESTLLWSIGESYEAGIGVC